jgi:hypothetical protein
VIPFRNDASETAPAFALLRATGVDAVDGQAVLLTDKPNDQFQRWYHVNGPVPVKSGQYGNCLAEFPRLAAWEGSSEPQFGETWGATKDSWKLNKNQPGFTILGTTAPAHPDDPNSSLAIVRQQQLTTLYGTLATGFYAGDPSFVVNILAGPAGAEVASGLSVHAADGLLLPGEIAPQGMRAVLHWINDAWYVTDLLGCTVT